MARLVAAGCRSRRAWSHCPSSTRGMAAAAIDDEALGRGSLMPRLVRCARGPPSSFTPPAAANDDVPAAKLPAKPPRKKARRNIGALPKHLPRCEQVLEPDMTGNRAHG